MERVIVIRYGELHLKGANRGFFERLLIADIKQKFAQIKCNFNFGRGRYIISGFENCDINIIVGKLTKVFGIHSVSVALKCESSLEAIEECSETLIENKSGTFKVEANRADKKFPLNSPEICMQLGGYLLAVNPDLKVDLFNPQTVLNVDVRDEGHTFVFCDKIMGAGGMPLNSGGRGLLLLSGGIDSPVAGYMMARRGLGLTALHFHSYPYTNEKAKQKVYDLAAKLAQYTNKMTLINVKVTKIQEEIHKNCDNEYTITLLRIIMMKIATTIAKEYRCECLVNGESLGQVASQTLESIVTTNSACPLPVLRPLIGMDKQEIIERAKEIDTFDISVLPFEDCCTVFLPAHPVIKPKKEKSEQELNKIPYLEELINEAVLNREAIVINA